MTELDAVPVFRAIWPYDRKSPIPLKNSVLLKRRNSRVFILKGRSASRSLAAGSVRCQGENSEAMRD
ncbi:MAG TPA: hypothetical protein VGO52_06520, partial [Hyphomonadaceae bacterium]|nr:hypothetical protein [Hyphomonadaceae bacterium]